MICSKYSKKDILVKPLGSEKKCIPSLEENGEKILNTAAISYYLSSSALRGGPSEYHQAEVLQWVDWCEGTLRTAVGSFLEFCSENLEKSLRRDTECHLQGLNNLLNHLDRVFLDLTFLVNERISLADITLFSLLLPIYQTKTGPNMLKTHVNLNRWFRTLHNQTQVKAALEGKSSSSSLDSKDNKPQKEDHVSGSELNKKDKKTPEATKVLSSEKAAVTGSALSDQDQTKQPDNIKTKKDAKQPSKEPETKSEVKQPSLVPPPTSNPPQQSEQAATGGPDTSQGNDQQKKKKNKNKKNKNKK